MAETTSGGAKSNFGFLGRKIGPAPVWLWGLLIVGAYYLYTKYKSGSSSSSSSQAIDPATGVAYGQELSDAEDTIQQLQAQLNQQQQGQIAPGPTTVNISETETSPGSGTPAPAPKPAAGTGGEKKIPAVAGQRAAYAISAVEAAGFETRTQPYRDPSKTYVATGTTPAGQAPAGSAVTIHVRQSAQGRAAAKTTTKAKKTARPKRKAPVEIPGGPVRQLKPRPVKHPARRAA